VALIADRLLAAADRLALLRSVLLAGILPGTGMPRDQGCSDGISREYRLRLSSTRFARRASSVCKLAKQNSRNSGRTQQPLNATNKLLVAATSGDVIYRRTQYR